MSQGNWPKIRGNIPPHHSLLSALFGPFLAILFEAKSAAIFRIPKAHRSHFPRPHFAEGHRGNVFANDRPNAGKHGLIGIFNN